MIQLSKFGPNMKGEVMAKTECGFCTKGVIDFGKGPRQCPYCRGTAEAPQKKEK